MSESQVWRHSPFFLPPTDDPTAASMLLPSLPGVPFLDKDALGPLNMLTSLGDPPASLYSHEFNLTAIPSDLPALPWPTLGESSILGSGTCTSVAAGPAGTHNPASLPPTGAHACRRQPSAFMQGLRRSSNAHTIRWSGVHNAVDEIESGRMDTLLCPRSSQLGNCDLLGMDVSADFMAYLEPLMSDLSVAAAPAPAPPPALFQPPAPLPGTPQLPAALAAPSGHAPGPAAPAAAPGPASTTSPYSPALDGAGTGGGSSLALSYDSLRLDLKIRTHGGGSTHTTAPPYLHSSNPGTPSRFVLDMKRRGNYSPGPAPAPDSTPATPSAPPALDLSIRWTGGSLPAAAAAPRCPAADAEHAPPRADRRRLCSAGYAGLGGPGPSGAGAGHLHDSSMAEPPESGALPLSLLAPPTPPVYASGSPAPAMHRGDGAAVTWQPWAPWAAADAGGAGGGGVSCFSFASHLQQLGLRHTATANSTPVSPMHGLGLRLPTRSAELAAAWELGSPLDLKNEADDSPATGGPYSLPCSPAPHSPIADGCSMEADPALCPHGRSNYRPGRDRAVQLSKVEVSRLFHLPIEKARRKVGLSKNAFKRLLGELGFQRWPQRQIAGLQNLMDNTAADKTLSHEQRLERIELIKQNRRAILDGSECAMSKDLQKACHVYHNRAHQGKKTSA